MNKYHFFTLLFEISIHFIYFLRLAVSDSLLIVDSIVQKSIVPYFMGNPGSFLREPGWFIVTYPYFWHPFKGIILTITIYMMVAISAERFRAVCYPLSKRHVSICNHFILLKMLSMVYIMVGRIFSLRIFFSLPSNTCPWSSLRL